MKAHIFKEKNWRLIPEEFLTKIDKATDGFHIYVEVTEAKANALPVVNPEVITTDEVPGEPGKPYEVGKLYEWPGTWEPILLDVDTYKPARMVAKLIAPQQPQPDKNCKACEIDRNDEQVKQMPEHTCGKDGPVERAQPKTAMTQSDAPNEGREISEGWSDVRLLVKRIWSRAYLDTEEKHIGLIKDYVDKELRDQLSKERETFADKLRFADKNNELLRGHRDELQTQLEKEREMRKKLVDCLKQIIPLAEDGYTLHKRNGSHQEFLSEDVERIDLSNNLIAKASELDKNQ